MPTRRALLFGAAALGCGRARDQNGAPFFALTIREFEARARR